MPAATALAQTQYFKIFGGEAWNRRAKRPAPERREVFVFLSLRVHPTTDGKHMPSCVVLGSDPASEKFLSEFGEVSLDTLL